MSHACRGFTAGFDHDRDLHVTPINGYNIIRGKPWLSNHNPDVNWEAKIVTVTLAQSANPQSASLCVAHRACR
jgi:hypothetical protein